MWVVVCCEPEDYSFNFSSKVDTLFTKLQNMKSYNYHIFIEALLPIAFSALPADMLEPLSAFGEFFKNLCANVFREDLLMKMHRNIALILCKLETIFPPASWNVMQHLLMHLAQEVYLVSLVHYQWMYPLEWLLV